MIVSISEMQTYEVFFSNRLRAISYFSLQTTPRVILQSVARCSILLCSRNFVTMVTWRHTFPLYRVEVRNLSDPFVICFCGLWRCKTIHSILTIFIFLTNENVALIYSVIIGDQTTKDCVASGSWVVAILTCFQMAALRHQSSNKLL